MRTPSRILLVPTVAIALALVPALAGAQVDINPPLPNVLLLIDTSGSMELMPDGKQPELEGATCTPGITSPQTPMNRWATLVSVLTGTINNFSCSTLDRSSASFLSEYQVSGVNPYDYKYYLPFHRILSNGCTPGPGNAGPNWWDWPNNAINYHDYSNTGTACTAPGFSQGADGVLDTFRDRVRFGLMTFDSFPNASTGPDPLGGNQGMWSYFFGWNSGGAQSKGNPAGCAPAVDFEVGARNPAAPPWEGRLMPFGAFDAKPIQNVTNNEHVQEAILAMRPYGATPMAGMLDDARTFILSDTDMDHGNPKRPFGPSTDPYFTGGCRKTFIIILSDGAPNLDLRNACASGNGKCPYQLPYEIARDLYTNADPNKRVLTYAVGFGLSNSGPTQCKNLTISDLTQAGGLCSAPANDTLAACCTLGRIAYEGGTTNAFFADDVGSLKSALSTVLGSIAAGSTSRTLPVFSSASSNAAAQGTAGAAAYQFSSSFNTPLGGSLWSGNLERKRFACVSVMGSLQAQPQLITPSKGDDFGANVNSVDAAHPRKFFTVIADPGKNGDIYSYRSIRPLLATDDGLGLYGGTVSGPSIAATFAATVGASPQAMGIDAVNPPPDCKTRLMSGNSGSLCAERTLKWEVGLSNLPFVPETRSPVGCPLGQSCSVFGSIYHSTPFTVGTPKDFLRDESYSQFAQTANLRPLVIYTATTDGQLHAFKVSPNDPLDPDKVDTPANNELWSFFPPAVLPNILPTYNQQAFLLDGAPVIKDVVFERSSAQSIAGGVGGAKWSTVLLAGGGAGGPFYYALDVTDPYKPKFLWQISTDDKGNSLFGLETVTPAIATIPLLDNGVVKEVAVAILPGGTATLLNGGSCNRKKPPPPPKAGFKPRGSGKCWDKAATSVTIVRLDNGKILMDLRDNAKNGPKTIPFLDVAFDAPMSGIPSPYPAAVGQVASRVYIGDGDGTLWRINLSNPDPTQWTVDLAWDAYSLPSDTDTSGEPIQTPPIVSIDTVGNNVILFSTGDQEQFTASGAIATRIWSITDKPVGSAFEASPNWYVPFTNGQRVTGPISLFNSTAYFATFTPTSAGGAACSDGFGSVWGLDYLLNTGGAYDKPVARYVADPVNAPLVVVDHVDQPAGTVVFGVAVTQTPTCSNSTTVTDAYMGSHTAVTDVSSGAYQLVFQTGKGGQAQQDGSKTNTTTKALPAPRKSTRIDSWASVVE